METIDSIQSQTYQDWELIIVDDGSDDNTEEKISGIEDERIHFHKAGRTGIGGRVKNIGLRKAKGELIAFIDSDDLWAPTKLEKQLAALQQYPEAGFSLTGGYNFRTPGQPLEYFYKQTEGEKYGNVFNSFFDSQLPGFTQALMVKKECLVVTGFFKEEKSFSDLDFIVNLALHFKAIILYEPLLYRRLHEASYINTTWKKSYEEGIGIIQFYKSKNLVASKKAGRALFTAYINFGEDCLLHKERMGAIKNFFTAWLNRPFSIIPLKKTGKAVLQYFKS